MFLQIISSPSSGSGTTQMKGKARTRYGKKSLSMPTFPLVVTFSESLMQQFDMSMVNADHVLALSWEKLQP